METSKGSFHFYAPEMFNIGEGAQVHGEKTDIWALGVTFYFLMCGHYPVKTNNLYELKEMVCNQPIDFSPIKNELARDLISKVL